MALDRITLQPFRNHRATSLTETGAFNVLTGPNGAGKTNVLEALSLFAPGRGLRRAALPEMAAPCEAHFAVAADLVAGDAPEPVRLATMTRAEAPTRRQVRINGAASPALTLSEWLSLAWLTPAMDGLFTDSAGERRRYMDRLALAIDPAHARAASRFEAALRERNRLLSDDRAPDPAWLDGVERHLSAAGVALANGRARLVAALAEAIGEAADGPFPRPALAYDGATPEAALDYAAQLREGRARDRAAGRTLAGPHRDDLAVRMAASGMEAARCSTGEQKALLVAITLTHSALAARGRAGVLLLDEIAAHLDPERRAALFERLNESGAQVWITGTEAEPFAPLRGRAAFWRVEAGAASPA